MIEAEVGAAIAQFGAAGLIGWMWVVERRAAAVREKQLGEAHERLMRERRELETLMNVVQENTRAVAGLEGGQRSLTAAIDRLASRMRLEGCMGDGGCGDGRGPSDDGVAA